MACIDEDTRLTATTTAATAEQEKRDATRALQRGQDADSGEERHAPPRADGVLTSLTSCRSTAWPSPLAPVVPATIRR